MAEGLGAAKSVRNCLVARLQSAGSGVFLSVLLSATLLFVCASASQAQSGGTGAIAGTVTDPQGRAVPNATVTATSLATNQERTATTGAAGDYKFSLLTPGTYRLRITAAGFKTAEVAAVTVNTTETAAVDRILEVGAVTQTVTVESSVETLQTESSTLGNTVSGTQITALPMANGNYTEILSLSAGTAASVDNATAVGKGTQDISANGVEPGSNNFQMDGVAVNNIANSGTANDATIYTGIPIPSADAIAEFKVQTSTYDASYGRNPGANVNLTTKSGSNAFHGSGFEYFRNSDLNASDYFYNQIPGRPHQILNQNQFGGTIGGPIKKDKAFFFFSYRGTRAKNGVAAQGQTNGALLPTTLNPFAALGSRGTCGAPAAVPDLGTISGECDATAQAFATAMGIPDGNIVGMRIFQLTTGNNAGVKNNYYLPSPSSDPQFCNAGGVCNFSVPAIYNENQYVANGDLVINSKHTLSTKYFYTANPQTLFLGQGGGDLPGTPVKTPWGNQAAVVKLTSLITSTFVNELRLSYQRNDASASIAMPPNGLANQLGMLQIPPQFQEPPTIIDVVDNFTLFGGLLPFQGPTNQLQAADQISWSHGKHSIRAGYEYEWTNWPLIVEGLQQGLQLVLGDGAVVPVPASAGLGFVVNLNGLEVGGFGSPAESVATFGPNWDVGLIFCLKGATGQAGITHFYQLPNQNAYVLDDWKVNSQLTLNMGVRWEFDGLLSDKYGRLSQVSLNRMAAPADVPTAFSTDPAGIQQYVVPSNFEKHFGPPPTGVATSGNTHSIEGHAPYTNFAPRIGFAWQPLKGGKLVVRGGVGIFYNREGLDFVVHAYETGSPYAATYDYPINSGRWNAATLTAPYPHISLVCMPSDLNCNADAGEGFAPRFANPSNDPAVAADSTLSAEFNPNSMHTPLIREYSLGAQYEFAQGWVMDVGYVGSSGINLLDYNHNHNQPFLLSPCNPVGSKCSSDPYGLCQSYTGPDNTGAPVNNEVVCNTVANGQFRVPYLGYSVFGLQGNDNSGYSNYNSLQVTVRHQFSHGLSLQAAYTWSKDLSTVFFSNTANINEALCMKCQYGPVSFNRPQRFVLNYSYDLPFGKGMSGVEGKLIDGWNVSGITIVQSGDPMTIINGNSGTAFGSNGTQYVDGVTTGTYCPNFGPGNVKSPGSTKANLKNYINPAAFCPAPIVPFGDPGTLASSQGGPGAPAADGFGGAAFGFGDSRTGIVLGPSQFNWDLSIMKNTKLTERVNIQFRTDFYNAFNHSQFADPGGTSFANAGFVNVGAAIPGATTAASIVHTNVNPRLIQFGLHVTF